VAGLALSSHATDPGVAVTSSDGEAPVRPGLDIRRPQLEKLSPPLARLLEVADDKLSGEITRALRECGDTVLECLMPALRLAADARRVDRLHAVARDCAERLDAIRARPLRNEDDWLIAWTG
jgi:hypothetical protein